MDGMCVLQSHRTQEEKNKLNKKYNNNNIVIDDDDDDDDTEPSLLVRFYMFVKNSIDISIRCSH